MVSHPKDGTVTGMVQIWHPLREWVEKTKPVLDPVEMATPELDPAESTVLGAMIAARAPKSNSLTVLIVVDRPAKGPGVVRLLYPGKVFGMPFGNVNVLGTEMLITLLA
jgi:hypothetical protein